MWGRLEVPLAMAGCVAHAERQPRRVEDQLPDLVAQLSRQLQQAARVVDAPVVTHRDALRGCRAGLVVPAIAAAALGRDEVVFVLDHHLDKTRPCIGIQKAMANPGDWPVDKYRPGGGGRQAAPDLTVTRQPS
jgi:hypothetical protein